MQEFTYKFFDIPNLENIQKSVWNMIKDDWKEKQLYLTIPLGVLPNPICEAINSFHDWNDVREVSLIIVQPYSEHAIHVDMGPITKTKYCFNIPIKNPEETTTHFYELKESKKGKFSFVDGVPVFSYQEADLIEIDKFVCNRPCFFNTQIPHNVKNNGGTIRALITIRCNTPFNFDKIFADIKT